MLAVGCLMDNKSVVVVSLVAVVNEGSEMLNSVGDLRAHVVDSLGLDESIVEDYTLAVNIVGE